MFSQDENPPSDASNTRRILTPISGSSLSGLDGLDFGGKKRKRDGNTMEDLLKDPFVVKVSNVLLPLFSNCPVDL
jgi:DNA replication regulator SLD3